MSGWCRTSPRSRCPAAAPDGRFHWSMRAEVAVSRASLEKEPHEVAAMFDGVAARYDRTNTLLSGGRDRSWRRATRVALDLRSGERCLDLAAGTGVSTEELARSGAFAVGADLS